MNELSISKEDQATKDLYKLLYKKRESTQYNDVKELIENSAKLLKVRSKYGLPICLAIRVRCSLDIIKLIKDNNGIDFEYKSYDYADISDHYYTSDGKKIQYDINYVEYVTIKNELIHLYEYVTGKRNSENTILKLYKSKYSEFEYRNIPNYIWPDNDIRQKEAMNYLLELCKILEINYDDIVYEIPDDIMDVTKLPSDSHPYNWHHWDYNYDSDEE